MWQFSRRRLRNESVIWAMLIFLQHFNLILAQNIQIMKSDFDRSMLFPDDDVGTTPYDLDEKLVSHSKLKMVHHIGKRDIRKTWSIRNITQAIASAGEKLRPLNLQTYMQKMNFTCRTEDHTENWRQWQENQLSYPFYMISYAILAYVQNCSDLVNAYVTEVYASVGKEEIRDTIEMFETFDIQQYMDQMLNKTESHQGDVLEPESEEQEIFKELKSVIATNMVRIESLSEVLLSLNDTQTGRSYAGLEEELDQTIAEYEIMTNLLHEPEERDKREAVFSKATELEHNEGDYRDKVDNRRNLVILRKKEIQQKINDQVWSKVQNKRMMKYGYVGNLLSLKQLNTSSKKHTISNRMKRQANNADMVYIKNDQFPCKLLSMDMGRLTFKTFNERDVYSQLWIWNNKNLQNYESAKYLNIIDSECVLDLQKKASVDNLYFQKGKLIYNDCSVGAYTNKLTGQFELCCDKNDNNQTWTFVSMDDVSSSVSLVSCLFVIQDVASCHVVTARTANTTEVNTEPLSELQVTQQLWYWDGDFIKNSQTHMYLSVDDTSENTYRVTLLEKDESYFQRWDLNNNILLPLGVSNFTMNPSEVYVQENASISLSINYINETKGSECVSTKDVFVIRHTAKKCKVLCTVSYEKPPSNTVRISVPSSLFLFGAILGLFSKCREETTTKVVILVSLLLGGLFSGISLVIIEILQLFHNDTEGIEFRHFGDDEHCLWIALDGNIKNYGTGHFLHVDVTDDDDSNAFSLGKESRGMSLRLQKGRIVFPFACEHFGFKLNSYGNLQLDCSRKEVGEWHSVPLDDSPAFVQSITCLYMLRPQGLRSCGVLSTDSPDSTSTLSIEMPTLDHVYNQLWYIDNESVINIAANYVVPGNYKDIESHYEWLEFKSDASIIETIWSCTTDTFFLKDSDTCKILSMNDNGDAYFQFYDFNNLTRQLWTWHNGSLVNLITQMPLIAPYFKINGNHMNYSSWNHTGAMLRSYDGKCMLSKDFNDEKKLLCSDMGDTIKWTIVDFDKDSQYLQQLVCTFYLQSQVSPCGYLTAKAERQSVFIAPMAVDVLDSQLWYISGNDLFHLQSDKRLGMDHDNSLIMRSKANTDVPSEGGWSFYNEEIIFNNGLRLVNVPYKNQLIMSYSSYDDNSTRWRLVESTSALTNPEELSCESLKRQYFFIKSDREPCKVLTSNGPDKAVSLEVFRDEHVESQLWFFESGKLVNFDQGDVLLVNHSITDAIDSEQTGILEVALGNILYYDLYQRFERDGRTVILSDTNGTKCYLSWSTNRLLCDYHATRESSLWTFVDYNDGLEDIGLLMCIFVLKNVDHPGQFITGYGEKMSLKVRPIVEELFEDQIFFWQDNFIIHKKSMLLLTAHSISAGQNLVLEKKNETATQQWVNSYGNIVPINTKYFAIGFDKNDDGLVMLEHVVSKLQGKWMEVNINQNDSELSGSYDLSNQTFFFIKSGSHPCKVLSGSNLGEEPMFEIFSKTNIEKYLWIHMDSHFINFESGLALMLETGEGRFYTQMWHHYQFANKQKWKSAHRGFFSDLVSKCPLHSFSQESFVSVAPNCKSYSGDIQLIEYDENAEFIDEITCYFFVKNSMPPCELLTAIDSSSIKPRKVHTDLVEGQLWYWDGNFIVNAMQDRYLTLNAYTNQVYFTPDPVTNWTYSYLYIQPVGALDRSLAIAEDRGTVEVVSVNHGVNESKQWIFVDRNEGIDNVNHLHCQSSSNPTMYLIRSEHEKCPLLATSGDNKVGTVNKITDNNGKNVVWMLDKGQILNGESMALTKDASRNVFLNHSSVFEPNQQWHWSDIIRSNGGGVASFLTYTGYHITLSRQAYSNQQKWKIFSFGQLKDDDKLLRCSRCYNKKEETAASVISWIPIIGWLYNIGRGIAYAVKKCPKVAMWAFIEGFVDVAMDLVTVITMGTAAGVALGIKTAFKLGFKAGLKIAFKAMASFIKNAIKKMAKNLVKNATKLLKGGFKATLKRQLSLSKLRLKSFVSQIKKFPRNFQRLIFTKLDDMKKLVRSVFKSTTKVVRMSKSSWKRHLNKVSSKLITRFKNMPASMRKQFSKAGRLTKKKLKRFGNKLADKGEDAIAKSRAAKASRRRIRCRRMVQGCNIPSGVDINVRINNLNMDVPRTVQKVTDDVSLKSWNKIKDEMVLQNQGRPGQVAAAGIKRNGNIDNVISSHIDDLRNTNAKPAYQDGVDVIDDNLKKHDVMHTEEFLLKELDKEVISSCTKAKPCEVMIYTKLSPCSNRLPPQALPCMQNIVNTCKRWFQSVAARCKVAFEKYYNDGLDTFSKDWDDYLITKIDPKQTSKLNPNLHQAASKHDEMISKYINENREVFVINMKKYLTQEIPKKLKGQAQDVIDQTRKRILTAADDALKKTNDMKAFWQTFTNTARGEADKKVFDSLKQNVKRKLAVNMRQTLNDIFTEKGTMKSIQDAGGFPGHFISFFQV